jgi:acylphosphatase
VVIPPLRSLSAVVHGRVQGVSFRWNAREEARRLGLSGWVRNLPEGTVDVYAVGRDDALERFLAWLGTGPPGARVTRVDASWGTSPPPPPGDFEIRL